MLIGNNKPTQPTNPEKQANSQPGNNLVPLTVSCFLFNVAYSLLNTYLYMYIQNALPV